MSKNLFIFTSLNKAAIATFPKPLILCLSRGKDYWHMADNQKEKDNTMDFSGSPRRRSLSRGIKMLREQYSREFRVPVYEGMWEKRGMFSKTIQEIAMKEDEKK
jgi:hypothetical protein